MIQLNVNDLPLAKDALQTVEQEVNKIHKEKAIQFEREVTFGIKRAITNCKLSIEFSERVLLTVPEQVGKQVSEKLSEKGYSVDWASDGARVTMFRVSWNK